MIAQNRTTYEVKRPTYSKNAYGEQIATSTTVGTVEGTMVEVSQMRLSDNPRYENISYAFVLLNRHNPLQKGDILNDKWRISQIVGRYCLCEDM